MRYLFRKGCQKYVGIQVQVFICVYLSGDDELKLENTDKCQINTFKPTCTNVSSVQADVWHLWHLQA